MTSPTFKSNSLATTSIQMSLNSDEFGDLLLVVPATSQYLAHVPYQTGTLTMYRPEVRGVLKIPAILILFVITDKYNHELDFMGWTGHNTAVSYKELVHESLETISRLYLDHVTEVRQEGVANGSITIQ